MSTFLVLKPEDKYALSIVPDALQQKTKALGVLAEITEVTNVEQLQAAAEALATAAGVVKAMESTRQAVKAPVIDAGKRIDTMAKEFSSPIEAKMEPVRKMVSDFHAAEARRVQAERDAEIARQQEAERVRLAEEARILRERQDRERKEAAEAAARAEEAKRTAPQEEEDPLAGLRAVSEEEEREESARKAQEAEDARLAQIESDRLAAQSQLAARPAAPAKVSGLSSRKVWKFEVENIDLVYKSRPGLCRLEINQSAVTQLINGHIDPLRECPGLKIYEDVETKVRAR